MTGEPADRPADWRRPLIAGALVLACAVGALVLSLHHASAALSPLGVISALVIAQPFAFLAIWFPGPRLARLAGPPATGTTAFEANALSVAFSLVMPGRLFEAVKPVALNLRTGLPLGRGFAAVALERLLDAGCLAVLAALAAAGTASQFAGGLRGAALTLAAFLVAGALSLFVVALVPRLAERLVAILPFAWLRGLAGEMLVVLKAAGGGSLLVVPAAWSVLVWAASFMIFFVVLGIAGSVPLTLPQILFVFVAGTLGFVVTVTPGGLGTYEGAIVLALGSLGYPFADALALAILLRITNILPAIAATAWILASGRFRAADLLERLRKRRDTP